MTTTELKELRNEIILGSIFYSDYENSKGINKYKVCDFFDGYLEDLYELMREELGEKLNDSNYFDYLKQYDTIENLENYYYCFEEDPLK